MERLWKADLENGTFQNPILFADYSDPDVIRVGDTFYMTASSFNYVPGLPILVSKDLINWKLVNYALEKINYDYYDAPQHAKGVWAPSIRYHKGEYYIYYGMPDEGIFMVKTKDPFGKWDKPVLVLGGKGLIDPCPFWDEDGSTYIIHGYAKSRIGFKSYLGIFPMSAEGDQAIDEDRLLFNGVITQPTIEGPKVYKRNGYYYIFAPAGGVKTGWQTVLRSRNIHGPYEEKVVMHQGGTQVNGPHQGGLVDTASGQEWFLHFQDRGLYGRIVHLQPVVWKEDWPIIGINPDENGCGEPCTIYPKPDTGAAPEKACYLEASDDFTGDKLNLMWQWLGNPKPDFFKLEGGKLRLFCLNPSGRKDPVLWENANVLTQKLVCPYFEVLCCFETKELQENEQAGMVMMGGHYAYLAVRRKENKNIVVYGQSYDAKEGMRENVKMLGVLLEDSKAYVRFRMERKDALPQFFMDYSDDGIHFLNIETDFMPSDHTWVGAKIGLFANTLVEEKKGGFADFDYIHVTAREE